MHTNQLTVDEGGECWVSADYLHLTDVDSLEDSLRVTLKRRPQHGDMYLDGSPLGQGQTFNVRDLKSLKVRSDIISVTVLNYQLVTASFSYLLISYLCNYHINEFVIMAMYFPHKDTTMIVQRQRKITLNVSLQMG